MLSLGEMDRVPGGADDPNDAVAEISEYVREHRGDARIVLGNQNVQAIWHHHALNRK